MKRGRVMIVLGLFFIVVGLELVREGIIEARQESTNTLKQDMTTKGYHVVGRA